MSWEVIHGDCLDVLKSMPDGSADAVVSDPPYGVRKDEGWDALGYFLGNLDDWMKECLRVSRLGVLWFGAGKTMPHVIRSAGCYFDRLLF